MNDCIHAYARIHNTKTGCSNRNKFYDCDTMIIKFYQIDLNNIYTEEKMSCISKKTWTESPNNRPRSLRKKIWKFPKNFSQSILCNTNPFPE